MPGITILGQPSKTVILAAEEDKITVQLIAAAAIKKGQPIKLDATGKAIIWLKTDTMDSLIGYAFGDANIGDYTTIWSRGFMMIYAIAKAAAQVAGPVYYDSYDTTTVVNSNTGYNAYSTAVIGTNPVCGWQLDPTVNAGDLTRILLQN